MSTLEIRNLTAQVRPTDESTEPKFSKAST